jgi:hypothetical protein
MKTRLLVSTLLLTLGFASAAHADTLRCGSKLIQVGANQGYVTEHCGVPESKETFSEPVYVRRIDGTTYQSGETSRDVWRYKRGHGKFPAVLTFEMGVLKKIEFEK